MIRRARRDPAEVLCAISEAAARGPRDTGASIDAAPAHFAGLVGDDLSCLRGPISSCGRPAWGGRELLMRPKDAGIGRIDVGCAVVTPAQPSILKSGVVAAHAGF